MFDRVLHAVACALHPAGLSTLRFNLRGTGRSEGRFEGGAGAAGDVRAAIEHAARDHDDVVLIGFSFGAWLGLHVGIGDARVSRMVGLGLPVRAFDFSYLADCKKPTLVIQGEHDEWGPVANVRSELARTRCDARLEVIAGGNHFFSRTMDPLVAAVVAFAATAR
jgi:alpha/beta superfamily hydrolase